MLKRLISKFYRFFRIDYDKLQASHASGFLFLDIFMIFLVIFNLIWIFFDYSFTFGVFSDFIARLAPRFHEFYSREIHPNFILYDLIFVAIFIVELTFRWSVAIVRKTYDKWFFYPFVHWYDVLGCIPLSAFRFLRLLRVFSMVYRLQRLGIIDLTSTFIYRNFRKYTAIFVEEVSDRVVLNVLDGIQDEISTDTPVMDRILRDVIQPKQDILVEWLTDHINEATTSTFLKHQQDLRDYVEGVISRAVRDNKEIARLKLIPGLGPVLAETLDSAISDITFNVITESMKDMASAKENVAIKEVTNAIIDSFLDESRKDKLDDIVTGLAVDSIEVIKEQVRLKQWKVQEEKDKEEKEQLREANAGEAVGELSA